MIQFGRHNRIEFRAGTKMGGRVFSTFDFLFVHRGKLSLEIAGNPLVLTRRKAVMIFPETRMRGFCEVAAEVSSLHFNVISGSSSVSFSRLENLRNGFEVARRSLPALTEMEVDRAVRLASCKQSPEVQERRVAQLLLLLSEWEIKPLAVYDGPTHAAEISELARWMEANLHQKIALQDMAVRVGLSTSQFRSVFKDLMGSSPAQFFLNIRMDAAKRMLLESNEAIKSIALSVGFEDISHFYRSFGQHTGKTPAEFRRAHSA